MGYIPQLDENRCKDDTEANRTLMEHMSAHMGPTAKNLIFSKCTHAERNPKTYWGWKSTLTSFAPY